MTDIYLQVECAHDGLYPSAPVSCSICIPAFFLLSILHGMGSTKTVVGPISVPDCKCTFWKAQEQTRSFLGLVVEGATWHCCLSRLLCDCHHLRCCRYSSLQSPSGRRSITPTDLTHRRSPDYVRSQSTMRVELIGHFKPCMTYIYLHI